jgi:predicted esterase
VTSDLAPVEWGTGWDEADLAVLALHGRGQDPEFMRATAARFGPAPVRFVAPGAPGNSWYPQPFLEPVERNQPKLDQSQRTVEQCVRQLGERGFGPERVVLLGFSQGACLLSQYALTCPAPFAGLVLLTGAHINPDPFPAACGKPLQDVPVVMRSIENDPWVPRWRIEETAVLLAERGASVDLRVDPGHEHIITDEACHAATEVLNRRA